MRAAFLLTAALTLSALAAGCTSDDNDRSATSTTAADNDDTTPEPDTTTTIYAALDDQTLEDTEQACVEAELGPDIDADQVPTEQLDAAVTACLRGGTFAQGFTDALAQDHPGLYTDTDLACLDNAYGQLTDDDLQHLLAAGLDPNNPPPQADQILNDLFGTCGVSRPPG